MSVTIAAPYPKNKVTTVLPDPEFSDARATEGRVQLKRRMLGVLMSYTQSSTRFDLRYRFLITRQKDLELDQFLRVYHAATWELTDHRGDRWKAQLIGEPVRRTATARFDSGSTRTGDEEIDVTLFFSAEKIS